MRIRLGALLLAALLVALLAAPVVSVPTARARAGDSKAKDLEGLGRYLGSFAKRKSLGKKDPDEIRKRIEGLGEEDLARLLEGLAAVPEKERGGAFEEVSALLGTARLAARYGPAVLLLPDAAKRLADPAPEVRCRALADLSRLEDPEPATRLALEMAGSRNRAERLRAVDALADLASFAGDAARLVPALHAALADPSPAVKDLALERLVDMADPVALDWSLEHLGDADAETAEVREKEEERRPGERAFFLLARLSKSHLDLEPAEFRKMPGEKRAQVAGEFRAWRGRAGNPLRDGDEGPFDPVARVTSAVFAAAKSDMATVRFWSDVDRAAFLLTLEDLKVAAASRLDYVASFRLTVMASGARQGNWEVYGRGVRCGGRHRLPRKGFALIETSIQPLLDGRVRVFVRSYESRGTEGR